LKQKMSKGEVMALVKLTVRQAKLGMQNTKDTLMIGATPSYCLGCGNSFPAGVNGIRASKVNHDAFSLSNATSLNDGGSKRRPNPLRAFRDVNKVPRPASTIIGSFAPSSTIVHNNMLHKQS
jgi:hypothetical protein